MGKVFERTVVTPDGSPGDFVINHRLMALMDFYVATSIFGGIPGASDYQEIYELRGDQNKAANGKGHARDMQDELKAVLKSYLDRFPHTLGQVRKSRKSTPIANNNFTTIDLTEEQLSEFASGPAG
jgi:hypothetical protein